MRSTLRASPAMTAGAVVGKAVNTRKTARAPSAARSIESDTVRSPATGSTLGGKPDVAGRRVSARTGSPARPQLGDDLAARPVAPITSTGGVSEGVILNRGKNAHQFASRYHRQRRRGIQPLECVRHPPAVITFGGMNVTEAIAQRRSIKKFQDRPLTREEIEPLLEAAVLAPNHHLTQPWRFYVLGPESRRRYGLALGERKARKLPDPDAANAVREKTAAEHVAFPALIAVAMVKHENPETREEDYAAVMQAVSIIMLAAVERGLGTHIRTGAVMEDPAARAAVGVGEGERIVAMLSVGVPAEVPTSKTRPGAAAVTRWTD